LILKVIIFATSMFNANSAIWAELDFYSVISLKQQSVVGHVTPLANIILIPSRPVFALSP
jgi:hypothetical protein